MRLQGPDGTVRDAEDNLELGRGVHGLPADKSISRRHSKLTGSDAAGWTLTPLGANHLRVHRDGKWETVVGGGGAVELRGGDRLSLGENEHPAREIVVQPEAPPMLTPGEMSPTKKPEMDELEVATPRLTPRLTFRFLTEKTMWNVARIA